MFYYACKLDCTCQQLFDLFGNTQKENFVQQCTSKTHVRHSSAVSVRFKIWHSCLTQLLSLDAVNVTIE